MPDTYNFPYKEGEELPKLNPDDINPVERDNNGHL